MAVADGLVTWVHLICASIWIGGSIFVGVVLVPVLRSYTNTPDELVKLMVRIGRRFNNVAVPAFAALMATGLYTSRSFFGDPGALIESPYGIILLMKIALVIATIGTYVVHVRVLNADMERKIMSGYGGSMYIQSVRSKIINFGRIIVALSITILLLAALLDSGL
jgi:putative copper export protein